MHVSERSQAIRNFHALAIRSSIILLASRPSGGLVAPIFPASELGILGVGMNGALPRYWNGQIIPILDSSRCVVQDCFCRAAWRGEKCGRWKLSTTCILHLPKPVASKHESNRFPVKYRMDSFVLQKVWYTISIRGCI